MAPTTALLHALLLATAVMALPVDGVVDAAFPVHASAGIPVFATADSIVTSTTTERDAESEITDSELDGEHSDISRRDAGVATLFRVAAVNHHNYHRSNHSASPLTWNLDMAYRARAIANTCVYAHKMDQNGGGYG